MKCCIRCKKGDIAAAVTGLAAGFVNGLLGAGGGILVVLGLRALYGKKKDTSAHWYRIKGTEKTVEWARSKIDEPKSFTLSEGWVAHP